MTARTILAVVLAFPLALDPVLAAVPIIGVIIHANRAHIGNASASVGSTLYDGDHLSTDDGGEVGIRTRAALLRLDAHTSVRLESEEPVQRTSVELSSGTLVFSTARASAAEIRADGALIRPASDQQTLAEVRVVGAKQLVVLARRGALEFSYQGQSQIISEGMSYRVILDPPDETAADSRGNDRRNKTPPDRRRPAFLLIPILVAAGVTAFAIHEALESPDKP